MLAMFFLNCNCKLVIPVCLFNENIYNLKTSFYICYNLNIYLINKFILFIFFSEDPKSSIIHSGTLKTSCMCVRK